MFCPYITVSISMKVSPTRKEAGEIEFSCHKKYVSIVTFVPPCLKPTRARKVAKPDNKKLFVLLMFKEAPIITQFCLEPSFHGRVATAVKWLVPQHGNESLAVTCRDNRLKILQLLHIVLKASEIFLRRG